jgi:hypothetical protein
LPEETGLESHFYSIENDDGSMGIRIEAMLAEVEVETSAAPVYAALLKGRPPDESPERMNFAEFLALIYLRTPTMRRIHAELHGRGIQIMAHAYGVDEDAFNVMIERIDKELGTRSLMAEQRQRLRQHFIDPPAFEFEISREHTLGALAAMGGITPIFFKMSSTVIAPRRGSFITSDNPLIRENDPKSCHPIYVDGGFANEGVQVIMPLSPYHALLMTWIDGACPLAVCEPDQVRNINRSLAAKSDRYLYAHENSQSVRDLSVEFNNVTTQGFGPEKFGPISVARRLTPNVDPHSNR